MQVGSEGLRALSSLTQLTSLRLVNTRVGNVGIYAMRGCLHLRSLNLTRTRINDVGARLLHTSIRCCIYHGGVYVELLDRPMLLPPASASRWHTIQSCCHAC